MDFISHLKKSISAGLLVIGQSKLQDWFALLSLENLKQLSFLLEEIRTGESSNVDYVVGLVYLLCHLEGLDLYLKYKDELPSSVIEFSYMVSLEILSRQGYILIHSKLSFSDSDNCQVELLTPPPFDFHLSLN